MRVAVEIQPMLSDGMTGVGWYTDNLVRLLKNFVRPEDTYYLLGMDYHGYSSRLKDYTASNVELRINGRIHYGIYRRLARFLPFPDYGSFYHIQADLYHFVNYQVPRKVRGRIVNTVYDMVYKTFPETMEKSNYRKLERNLSDSCKRSDAIVTISENSKRELMGYLGIPEEKIHIISPGVDQSVYRPVSSGDKDKIRRKYGLPEKYLLYLGTIEPRKNIPVLIHAFHQFSRKDRQGYQLVIAGKKGWMFQEVFDLVKRLELEDRVIFPGYVAEADKPCLYAGADVFLFPSLYEGFGMPPLEAMACGVPVITSNTSSLPEVVGDAGIQADPGDIDAICSAMLHLTSDPEARAAMKEKGLQRAKAFSWEDSVKKLLSVYEKLE